MKIIDCFPFFNEEYHLVLRIKLLQNYVDGFVICEANRTHSGIDKEYKCKQILEKYNLSSNKISVIHIELEQSNNWNREREQRNAVSKLIQEDEVWFISDCDEIINPIYLKTLADVSKTHSDRIVRVPMSFHSTRADLCIHEPNGAVKKWKAPFFCLKKHVEEYTLSELREVETLNTDIKYKSLIVNKETDNEIVGWHLSWMGDASKRIQKLESFMHVHDIVDDGIGLLSSDKTKQHVKEFNAKEGGTDILGRADHVLHPYPIDKLPKIILEDSELKNFFLPPANVIQYIYQENKFEEEYFKYPKLCKSIRTHIINYIAKKINAKSYLEIGVDDCVNFNDILVKNKIGVDPYPKQDNIVKLTSDEFFKTNKQTFDIIFIDGLHHVDQVYKDIINSLGCLNKNGYIICHDMLPTTEEMQIIPFRGGAWTGDCWKAFVHLRQIRADLEMYTIDVDMGLGVITRGKQEKIKISEDITYNNFTHCKHEWMNIQSILSFYKLMGEEDVLKALLDHFIQYPEDAEINFYTGCYYHDIGQTASAVSYYLRAAERTNDELVRYEALLRAGMCFNSQGSRNNSVEGMLQHAVALIPTRPEGYFYLSRFYEHAKKWFSAYTMACIGEKIAIKKPTKLKTTLDYPGFYGLTFERAITGWWTGLCNESKNLFKYLSIYEPLDTSYKQATIDNLKFMKAWKNDDEFISFLKTKDQELETSARDLNLYNSSDLKKLKYKFNNAKNIDRNYSEAFQDMFVLTLLDGKKNGTYLEIGAGYPFYGNNTYLLESKFNWKGISLDITYESIERYFRDRNNIAVCRDATQINYIDLLEEINFPRNIDYLQLDCDPSSVTYDILTKIPFHKYKFAIITYEHDHCTDKIQSYKLKSREYLLSEGYELILSNIAPHDDRDYEDWYVHPDLVSRKIINKIKNTDDTIKVAKNIFL